MDGRKISLFVTLCIGFLAPSALVAADYSGNYVVEDGEFFIQLILQQKNDGTIEGAMDDDESIYTFTARPIEDKIVGAIIAEDGSEQFPILGQANAHGLLLKIYTEVDQQGNVVESSAQLFQFRRTGNNETAPGSSAGQQPPTNDGGGVNLTETALSRYLAGKHVLFSYRDGGVVYGTYYFYNTHHCSSGYYIDYANSSKQSVLGGQINKRWESNGTWQVTTNGGQIGTYYRSSNGEETFWPMQLNGDGSVYINERISSVVQGPAQCQ